MQTSQENISTGSQSYTIKQFTKDDIPALEELHKAVYGQAKPPGYYPKKYDVAFTGKQPLGYIVYDNNRQPMAYYGVLPCFMKAGNNLVLAAQSADSMTHPQLQAKGLFTELSKKTFELCRSEGVLFLFGFPNQNSYSPAIKKLGWQEIEVMDVFTISVKGWRLPRIFRRISGHIYNSYKGRVLKQYITHEKGIPNSIVSGGFTGIYRDEQYLQYRTYSETFVIQAGSSKAWISIGASIYIGDIELKDGLQDVLHVIKDIAVKLGINTIFFQASKGTSLHTAFSGLYPATSAFPVFVQDFGSGLDLSKIKFGFADIDIF
jgi:hypothetical protein